MLHKQFCTESVQILVPQHDNLILQICSDLMHNFPIDFDEEVKICSKFSVADYAADLQKNPQWLISNTLTFF